MKCYFLLLCYFWILIISAQTKTEDYILKYSSIAVEEMNKYNIPASITLAQGILESGSGESRLAKEGNNHFGIKCHDNWEGQIIIEDDDKKGECFRKYLNAIDSYRDHSIFLTERSRYSFLFKYSNTDYKKWAKGLKKAGYATNSRYANLLVDLIEKYNLSRFDKVSDKQKSFYFAHSYGLPYLTGVGCYYFYEKSLYSIEINTSFAFSETNIGYNYNFFHQFYVGSNMGMAYFPLIQENIIPQIAGELVYKKNFLLMRGTIQFPLSDIKYKIIPSLKLTYLMN